MPNQPTGPKAKYSKAISQLSALKATKATVAATALASRSAAGGGAQTDPEGVTPSTIEPTEVSGDLLDAQLPEISLAWDKRFSDFKQTTILWIVGTGLGTLLATIATFWGMLTFALDASDRSTTALRDESLRSIERVERRLDGLEGRTGDLERPQSRPR